MSDQNKKIPSPEEVRAIFNETYNVFYKKWKEIINPDDWVELMQEVRDLNDKFSCSLCQQILLELVDVIEQDYITRRDSSG